MINLQVLRYMGILTIMKLGVFAVSAISLVLALTWVLIYCPVDRVRHLTVTGRGNPYHVRNRMESDYIKQYNTNVDNDVMKTDKKGSKPAYEKKDSNKVEIPLHLYKDEAFETMIDQLNNKDVEGYEFLAESTNLTIYRKPRGDAGLYQYRLYVVMPDATPDQIAAVFLDNEYRVVWDEYVTELYPVEENEKGPDVIYFNIDYPWPLANRDYVYARETRKLIREAEEYIIIVMHSAIRHNVKEVQGAIRVSDYHQSLALRKWQGHGTQAYIEYYDNPKGSIPSWLINWAAKTGVPAFIKDLQRACKGLPAFLETKHRPAVFVEVQ